MPFNTRLISGRAAPFPGAKGTRPISHCVNLECKDRRRVASNRWRALSPGVVRPGPLAELAGIKIAASISRSSVAPAAFAGCPEGRLALSAAGEDARRTAAETAALRVGSASIRREENAQRPTTNDERPLAALAHHPQPRSHRLHPLSTPGCSSRAGSPREAPRLSRLGVLGERKSVVE